MARIKMLKDYDCPTCGLLRKNWEYELDAATVTVAANQDACIILDPDDIPLDMWANIKGRSNQYKSELYQKYPNSTINIIGAGPSAKDFVPNGNPTIACNKSISLGVAQYGIMVEGIASIQPWFREAIETDGVKFVLCSIIANFLVAKYPVLGADKAVGILNMRPMEWWRDVIWSTRAPYKHGKGNLRDMSRGTLYSGKNMSGSVGLAAIGMAAGMGATEIHTWGMEYCFPDGKQHWDGSAPYQPCKKNGQAPSEQLIEFDIDNGECTTILSNQLGFPGGHGQYLGTSYFCMSAEAILDIMAENAGIKLVDHSGGLLTMLRN